MSECQCTTKVIHVYKRRRRNWFGILFGKLFKTVTWIPGFRLFTGFIILLLVWIGLRVFTPNYDIPYILGAACTTEVEAGGFAGVMYDAGSAVGGLNNPPSPAELKSTLKEVSIKAGEAWAGLKAGLEGEPVPEKLVEEPPKRLAEISDTNCGPCPTAGSDKAVPVGTTGIDLAARVALASGWNREQAIMMTAIAKPESDWNENPVNPNSSARGLFQTMMSYHAPKYGPGEKWSDPFANGRVAYEIWKTQGYGAWEAYNNGLHTPYLDDAEAAVDRALGSSDDGRAVQASITTVAASTDDAGVADGGVPTKEVALKAASFIRSQWGYEGSIGGSATSGHIEGSKHYSGLALDVMIPVSDLSGEIVDYFTGPGFEAFGVENVIHNNQIYNRPQGWHAYTGSNPHTGHIHIDFREDGGSGDAPSIETAKSKEPKECLGSGATPISAPTGDARVASFNILGRTHSAHNWRARMQQTTDLLDKHQIGLVGLQEFQLEQYRMFSQTMPDWEIWFPGRDTANAIAWRASDWTLVEARTVSVPYFYNNRAMPVVKLRHSSGNSVWMMNVHNPADAHGPAEHKRDKATRIELALAKKLRGEVLFVGDMNDRSDFYCPAQVAGFHAANPNASCGDDSRNRIDWVLGTSGIGFSGYQVIENKASDHPMIYADMQFSHGSRNKA